ncbi:DODA-type extradiol aromatic ring-opening family dioxygenase [Zwartia vadi]|uniref:DODA-type extradiol aromatic ring-opening family dioxygenase n=1 Tax=Zwartia vadi TaxID=3058168 RepID=UPI0025B304C2|nr:class III extradiol ring-cleavage dioxygenase [Zwartia vadi]MDN3987520.1 class III extradiol ring-cleavage dioxygenase [Zwartia vadi]
MTTTPAPVLFVSHGSPMLAIEPGALGAQLAKLGAQLDKVRGIVVVSPHWQTRGLKVGGHLRPETIHDFSGFPRVLYTLHYPARGSQDLSRQVRQSLESAGLKAELDPEQGLDHGAWVPLMHLRPQADIPIIPVSLPEDATPASALLIGQALSVLREEGIAIIGSGSMTHNLYEFRGGENVKAQTYVEEFSTWVRDAIQSRDLHTLLNYRTLAPHAVRAHPTDEHFLPLFVALGASSKEDAMRILETEVRHGMLSMESYVWGESSLPN